MDTDPKLDVYKEVLTAIIQRFIVLIGNELALRLARRVYGVHVEEDGTVTRYQGDGMIVIQGVVLEYMTLLGPEVLALSQRAITPTKERNPDVKLPSLLK